QPLAGRVDGQARGAARRAHAAARASRATQTGGAHRPSRERAAPAQARRRRVAVPGAIVTGSRRLVGSEAGGHPVAEGFDVLGRENDMRARFFGLDASTASTSARLSERYPNEFRSLETDIRDADSVMRVFADNGPIELVIHTAAQPSHDWAASDPQTDF